MPCLNINKIELPTDEAFCAEAPSQYGDSSDNNIEVDLDATVSKNNNGGAWVQAWLYV